LNSKSTEKELEEDRVIYTICDLCEEYAYSFTYEKIRKPKGAL